MEAGTALQTRSHGVPGIGLIWGATGYGKTTASAYAANLLDAICIRANATWTKSALLSRLMKEMSAEPRGSCSQMLDYVVDALKARQRPVMIDEADYLLNRQLLETLRDIHDLSGVPLILIGMADFRRRIMHREQLAGRIAQWVEFKPADLEDASALAACICDITVAPDLLAHLHTTSKGSMRALVVGLERIELYGKRHDLSKVTLKDWGRQELTLSSASKTEAAN